MGLVRESFTPMKSVFKVKCCAIAAMLMVSSFGSQAMTLGRARGAALISQPFNVSIAVTAAPDEDVTDICFEADVFYGENKVEGNRVSVVSETPLAGQTWQVRITSRVPVDEPIVTVFLRSVCSAKAQRRYVLLADVVSDTAAPLAAAAATVPQNLQPQPKTSATGQVEQNRLEAAATGSGLGLKQPAPTKPPRSAAQSLAKKPVEAPVSTSKPRLKLVPLDLSVERDPVLRPTEMMVSAPTEDLQKRADAAALWRSLNLTPEDVLKDAGRLKTLETDIQSLRNAASANQKELQGLAQRIEQAESEKYFNPLVIGLAGLLLAASFGVFWMWRRQNARPADSGVWWSPEESPQPDVESTQEETPSFLQSLGKQGSAVLAGSPAESGQTSKSGVDVDIDLDIGPGDQLSSLPPGTKPEAVTSAFSELRGLSAHMPASLRAVNSQEMIDVRQQAEFFMALGQYDEAISLLEGHVSQGSELNPMVYLDLLKILHTLSRKDRFDYYRAEFNAIFTGYVPEYAAFGQAGGSLEDFPQLCAELEKIWPSQEALSLIELYLVRKSSTTVNVRFELEAYKELLLLHAVCNRLLNALDGVHASFSTNKQVVEEGHNSRTGSAPVSAELPIDYQLGDSVDFELDIAAPNSSNGSRDNLIEFDLPLIESDKAPR
jgi:hypothetical protein